MKLSTIIAIAAIFVPVAQGALLWSAHARVTEMFGVIDSQGEMLMAMKEQIDAQGAIIDHMMGAPVDEPARPGEHAL